MNCESTLHYCTIILFFFSLPIHQNTNFYLFRYAIWFIITIFFNIFIFRSNQFLRSHTNVSLFLKRERRLIIAREWFSIEIVICSNEKLSETKEVRIFQTYERSCPTQCMARIPVQTSVHYRTLLTEYLFCDKIFPLEASKLLCRNVQKLNLSATHQTARWWKNCHHMLSDLVPFFFLLSIKIQTETKITRNFIVFQSTHHKI